MDWEEPPLFDAEGNATEPFERIRVAESSRDKHHQRMRAQAMEALEAVGFSAGEAAKALAALSRASTEFCVCCGYKRKGVTGSGGSETLQHLDGLETVLINPQRDGDAGDLEVRERHYIRVLRHLYLAEDGLTDQELSANTGIFLDSAKAARANLVTAGWVRVRDTPKRDSVNNCGMTVWELTPAARERLDPF